MIIRQHYFSDDDDILEFFNVLQWAGGGGDYIPLMHSEEKRGMLGTKLDNFIGGWLALRQRIVNQAATWLHICLRRR